MKVILELAEMPKTCDSCPLIRRSRLGMNYCSILVKSAKYDTRRPDCPLKEDKSVEEIAKLKQRLEEAAKCISENAICPDDFRDRCIDSCYECWLEYLNRET